MTLVEIIVDEENNAERWWDAAWAADDVPNVVGFNANGRKRSFADWLGSGPEEGLVLPREDVDRVLGWAIALPGWDDGPDHAPTPLLEYEGDVVGRCETAGQAAVNVRDRAWTAWRGGSAPASDGEVFRSDDAGDLIVRNGEWVEVDPDSRADREAVAEMFG